MINKALVTEFLGLISPRIDVLISHA